VIDPSVSAYYVGDCRKLLAQLPDGCVQTCVTSPPYWGLRDYEKEGKIGLEDTPEEYLEALMAVFAGVWRVLREDGTLWLNLGDCYAGSRSGPQGESGQMADRRVSKHRGMMSRTKGVDPKNKRKGPGSNDAPNRRRHPSLKPKDLVGIPWTVASALRDAGWYLRMDNVWSKPNPMPESVTDRTTKSHEYLFHLTKSQSYYYNGAAIAEPVVWDGQHRNVIEPCPSMMPGAPPNTALRKYKSGNKERKQRSENGGNRDRNTNQTFGVPWENTDDLRNKRSVWTVPAAVTLEYAREQARLWTELVATWDSSGKPRSGLPSVWATLGLGYPRSGLPSVWAVTPQPYHGAHFATFPPLLIEPCILACSRPGDLVLDPFFGSGTTGEVAEKHERRWIGFDINPKYAALAKERTAQRTLPLSR
jgi:site-specific DNA-methyltransferase (cytosine-N4-specific)